MQICVYLFVLLIINSHVVSLLYCRFFLFEFFCVPHNRCRCILTLSELGLSMCYELINECVKVNIERAEAV